MSLFRLVLVGLLLQLFLVACAGEQAAVELGGETQDQSSAAKDPNFEVVAATISAPDAIVSICYDLPSELDWVLGRLHGDVSLSDGSQSVPMSSFTLASLESSRRCDNLKFNMPADFGSSNLTMVIHRLAASLPADPDWTSLQQRLHENAPGIAIEPLSGQEGLSFALIQKPDHMTDLEAHNVVVGMADPVVIGPWVLQIDIHD